MDACMSVKLAVVHVELSQSLRKGIGRYCHCCVALPQCGSTVCKQPGGGLEVPQLIDCGTLRNETKLDPSAS